MSDKQFIYTQSVMYLFLNSKGARMESIKLILSKLVDYPFALSATLVAILCLLK